MKRHLAVVVIAMVLCAQPVFATCPTPETGPYYIFPYSWYDYSADPDCVDINYATPDPVTMWCYSTPAWSIGTSFTELSYTFTANQSFSFWDADVFLEFDDPNNSAVNWFEMRVNVTHNNTTTTTMLASHNGTNGDISCQRVGGGFSAAQGDTVEIIVYAQKYNSTGTIQISAPSIYGYY